MLVLELPVIAAALARSDRPGPALAGIGVALSIVVVVNSPALAIAPLVVTRPQSVGSRAILLYSLAVGALAAALLLLAAGVPAVFVKPLDLHGPVIEQARAALAGFAPASFAVAWRRYLHGRLIVLGRTGGIGAATVLRLVGSGSVAWLLGPGSSTPGLVGGTAFASGALVESLILSFAVHARSRAGRRQIAEPPEPASDPVSRPEPSPLVLILRAHAPLTMTRLLNMSPQIVTTITITHSGQAGPSVGRR
jgi:hypothetical protein